MFKAFLRGAECLFEMGYAKQCNDWIDSRLEHLKKANLENDFEQTKSDYWEKLDALRAQSKQEAIKQERDLRKERLIVSPWSLSFSSSLWTPGVGPTTHFAP